MLTSYMWNTSVAATGGDWDTKQDWLPVGIQAGDTATIDLTSAVTVTHDTAASDAVLGLMTNSDHPGHQCRPLTPAPAPAIRPSVARSRLGQMRR